MFVTMLVSVTRTIVLVTPFHELSRRAVSSSVVAYAVLLTGVDIVFFSLGFFPGYIVSYILKGLGMLRVRGVFHTVPLPKRFAFGR